MSIIVQVSCPDFVDLKTLVAAMEALGLTYQEKATLFYCDNSTRPCKGKFTLTKQKQTRQEIGLQYDGKTWSLQYDRMYLGDTLKPLLGEKLEKLQQEYQVARSAEYCLQNGLQLERVNNADGTIDLYYNQ